MPNQCEKILSCGFLQKWQELEPLACEGFIALYCRGPQLAACKRRQFCRRHGRQPDNDMMPNGLPVMRYPQSS